MPDHILSTELLAGQGLGNQLWAYAATRSISNHLGFGFTLKGINQFKGGEFLTLSDHTNMPLKDSLSDQQLNYPAYYERQYYDPELKLFSTYFDKAVLELSASHDLRGYFQSEDYFFGNTANLKSYISIDPKILQKNTISQDICVLNLRGGEYKRFKNLILPTSYWQNAQKNMRDLYGVSKFIVVTDDFRYGKAMFPSYEIISGNIADCYGVLNNAKYVVVSNSSFSYFPIKTNLNSPIVIAPQYWSRFGNVYGRWAAPANLYSDWLWQGSSGQILDLADCEKSVQETMQHYQSRYFISCSPTQLRRQFEWKQLIPKSFRPIVKKFLSFIFPTIVG